MEPTDSGFVQQPIDSGTPEDAGSSDSGTPTDAGLVTDGGSEDGGLATDAGTEEDAGELEDAGAPGDGGSLEDGGMSLDAGGSVDAGSIGGDGGSCTPDSAMALCSAVGATCGSPPVVDNCGNTETPDCGSCGTGATCSPLEFICECPAGESLSNNECVANGDN